MELLSDVQNFSDLEERIKSYPALHIGTSFEQFAKLYFQVQRYWHIIDFWRPTELPLFVQHHLNMPSYDRGIDFIARTQDQKYVAIQVKFRTTHQVSWSDLTSFLALAERADYKIIFTNTPLTLPTFVTTRPGLYLIDRSILQQLTIADFKMMRARQHQRTYKTALPKPYPLQEEALQAILSTLKQTDRTTAILPCGSGKSLLALWLAERLQSRRILIFCPTLMLLEQTALLWNHATQKKIFLLCSATTTPRSYPMTTDSAQLQDFLDHTQEEYVVLSTYRSSSLIPKRRYDLAIYDEAHHTVGHVSFANHTLHELSITKRVFLTATPKNLPQAPYSMDNPAHYGSPCYHMTLATAIEAQMLTPYEILVSTYQTETDREYQDKQASFQAVTQALQKLLNRNQVHKILCFHTTIRESQCFIQHIRQSLPDIWAQHLDGTSSLTTRRQQIADFSAQRQAILSNARCLNEGIDLPHVDLVAFVAKKSSPIDVTQIVGRALRKSPGKHCGYILVPIKLDSHTTLEQAVIENKALAFWTVLHTLLPLPLKPRLHSPSSPWQTPTSKPMPQEFPNVQNTRLTQVTADDFPWLSQYIALRKGQQHPQTLSDELTTWIKQQQHSQRAQRLTSEQVDLLASLGVAWLPKQTPWQQGYERLTLFYQKYGHTHVTPREHRLYQWVLQQRQAYAYQRLSKEQITQLTQLNFIFQRQEAQWFARFYQLKSYSQTKLPDSLVNWSNQQRLQYQEQQLSANKVRLLNSIGFVWRPSEHHWQKRWQQLKQGKQRQPDFEIKLKKSENSDLWYWIQEQRRAYKAQTLPEQRLQQLHDIGFIWSPRSYKWFKTVRILQSKTMQATFYTAAEQQWLYRQKKALQQGQLDKWQELLIKEIFNMI